MIVGQVNKIDLKNLKIGDKGSGTVLLKDCQKMTSKKGAEYFRGEVVNRVPASLIAWSSSGAFTRLKAYCSDFIGRVVMISYEVIEFAGSPALSITAIQIMEDLDVDDYVVTRYNIKSLSTQFLRELEKNLSPKAFTLYKEIMQITDGEVDKGSLWYAFTQEYAAMRHHDNCAGGLLAHTYKCLIVSQLVLLNYDWVCKTEVIVDKNLEEGIAHTEVVRTKDEVDLFILSVILHDIGKVEEMLNGVYQPGSEVSHREIGIEMLFPYKKKIIELYGDRGWNYIRAVLLGHHDEYEDKARTVPAYLVHLIDNFDATITGIGQTIETATQENSVGKNIWYNNRYLYL